ncbi:MAG TPA: hypothetical protein EYP53_04250 [Candidatus Latescibacteria bacterium]|nr:hypothetical protein [Candidatus Latescibacterota bacterium]
MDKDRCFWVGSAEWGDFLGRLVGEASVYALGGEGGRFFYRQLIRKDIGDIVYNPVRAVQPLKSFIFSPREEVVGPSDREGRKQTIIVGVKACDISSLEILDRALKETDLPDPVYQERRQRIVLISSDCSEPQETCFCTLVGRAPYPESGFDLNLSKVDGGFVVAVGSERGAELVDSHRSLFREATAEEIARRDRDRGDILRRVDRINESVAQKRSYQEIVKDSYSSELWVKHSESCVECTACNNICPTCHCYLLDDVSGAEGFVKVRSWDSCVHTGYARVAGGLNPRPHLWERFRNRYLCKFLYMKENFGLLGCTGCGRCIEACQGKIDMREVLQELAG